MSCNPKGWLKWRTYQEAADAIGVALVTVQKWAAGRRPGKIAQAKINAALADNTPPKPKPKKAKPKTQRKEQDGFASHGCYWRLCSTEELQSAQVRPKNCSPARWRMELRRRGYGSAGAYFPHPDLI